MPVPQSHPLAREYVSLSQLAEDILGLSRARVYELIERGALPPPLYDTRSRRPIFDSVLQRQCAAVRQTGVGIDGSSVIFYRRDKNAASPPAARRTAEIVASLQALGVSADELSVSAAIAQCFPNGIDAQQEGDVIRAVFRLLRSQRSGE